MIDLTTLAEALWPLFSRKVRPRYTWYAATNNSGGALAAGDVVVVDSTADRYVTTSASAGNRAVAGVVVVGGADGSVVYVATSGVVDVNVTGAVTRAQGLRQSGTAKLADAVALGTAGIFGIAVEAAAGPGAGQVRALISVPAQ